MQTLTSGKHFQTFLVSQEGVKGDSNIYIPAQLLSHFIIQLNIFLPEASHGVLTLMVGERC